VGGDHVTADLHECLQLPMVEAERLKQNAGCALAWMVGDHEQVELSGGGGRKTRQIARTQVAGVIEARYEEILNIVGASLEQAGWPAHMLASVVLTGGASNIPGLPELAERVLSGPAVRGEPHDVYGLVDVVKNPRYATATGLVLAALRGNDKSWVTQKTLPQQPNLWTRIIDWIR
jgi:cell division protein FtsA